tara:strand:- start:125 stop:514 length:390 start_codon:yes stop_codon:yes gene_type:complete
MKIYLKENNKKISEKINLMKYEISIIDQIFSDEGIFTYDIGKKKIFKLIIKKDNVYELDNLIIDDSDIEYIEHNKIPLKYKQYKIEEKKYIIDEKIKLVVVNNKLYYFKCDDIDYFKNLYIEICNKVFI